MRTSYNRLAGQSSEWLAALSDGIFALRMTLMVQDLRLPAGQAMHREHDLGRALVALLPRVLYYLRLETVTTAPVKTTFGSIDFGLDAEVELGFPVSLRRVLGGRHVDVLGG